MRTEEVILGKPARGTQNVVTFDEHELRVRLFEAMVAASRQPGRSAAAAWAAIEEREPQLSEVLSRMARACTDYVVERMKGVEQETLQ